MLASQSIGKGDPHGRVRACSTRVTGGVRVTNPPASPSCYSPERADHRLRFPEVAEGDPETSGRSRKVTQGE